MAYNISGFNPKIRVSIPFDSSSYHSSPAQLSFIHGDKDLLMDLGGERSPHESVEDNDVKNPEKSSYVEGNRIENNGSCGSEHDHDHLVSSPPLIVESHVESLPPATTKGYGLKKWRRIRREFSKDGSSNLDASKILKRGLSANSTRPQGLPVGIRQKGNGSLSSTSAMVHKMGVATDGFASHGSSLDSRLPIGLNSTDSDNSEDRSSKSSTAASVQKSKHEIPSVVGNARDKNRMKSLGGKNVINPVQMGGRQGKSRIESSKKPRGERVKIENENSYSSVESDSRSSNFVFVQGANSVTSNGRQSRKSANFNGENSDEDQDGKQHYIEENVGEFENLSNEEIVENHRSSRDLDPIVESIFTLQSVQEALEREIQKLRETGNEHISLFDSSTTGSSLPLDSIDLHEASSSDLLHAEEITHVMSLKHNVNLLESKLEEANALLKVKDAKVMSLKGNESPKEEMRSTIELQQRKYRDMEAELEGLFKQKIEAEVEYLAISRTIHESRVRAVDHPQIFNELGDTKGKAEMVKRQQAEKMETYCEDIVETTDQVLKLQKRVCKVTWCFFVQSILLFVVFALFFLQLSPRYTGIVPT